MERTCHRCGNVGTDQDPYYQSEKTGEIICQDCYMKNKPQDVEESVEEKTSFISSISEKLTKTCSYCGKEGKFIGVSHRKDTMFGPQVLCNSCYREEQDIITDWKNRILSKFYDSRIKQLCRENNINLSVRKKETAVSKRGTRYKKSVTHYYTVDELIHDCIRYIPLDTIIDFSQKNRIPIRDVLIEIDDYKTKKEYDNISEETSIDDELFSEIITAITEFQPLIDKYDFELGYHVDLARYLKNKFPSTAIEVQKGSSRPDIEIENIAIEVKGPTEHKDLNTIVNKCLRYPQHFKRGLIMVLFDMRGVTNAFFEEWKTGVNDQFPKVRIIKK